MLAKKYISAKTCKAWLRYVHYNTNYYNFQDFMQKLRLTPTKKSNEQLSTRTKITVNQTPVWQAAAELQRWETP